MQGKPPTTNVLRISHMSCYCCCDSFRCQCSGADSGGSGSGGSGGSGSDGGNGRHHITSPCYINDDDNNNNNAKKYIKIPISRFYFMSQTLLWCFICVACDLFKSFHWDLRESFAYQLKQIAFSIKPIELCIKCVCVRLCVVLLHSNYL